MCATKHNQLPPPLTHTQVMSKPFTPGADRLASLETTINANTGCPVLETANAVLECKVVSAQASRVLYAASLKQPVRPLCCVPRRCPLPCPCSTATGEPHGDG
jgi:hypothetical protein